MPLSRTDADDLLFHLVRAARDLERWERIAPVGLTKAQRAKEQRVNNAFDKARAAVITALTEEK